MNSDEYARALVVSAKAHDRLRRLDEAKRSSERALAIAHDLHGPALALGAMPSSRN